MTSRLPLVVDGHTARLIAFTRAIQAEGAIPKASADGLVRCARAVRLYCEAYQNKMAGGVLGDMAGVAEEMRADAATVQLGTALGKALEATGKAIA